MDYSFTTALTTTVFVLTSILSQTQAQSNRNEERDIRKGWIAVVLGDDGKPKEDIGAALTLKEAQDLEREWTARRPGTVILTDSIEGDVEVSSGKIRRSSGLDPRPKDSGNPIDPKSKIVGSNLKPVDPGARADSTRAASNDDRKLLVGKKFKGTIGDAAIDFDFVSNEKVKISSKVQGKALEAKWYLDEKGQLRIDANADFVAIRRGEKFEGIRTSKDKKDKRPWSFDLRDAQDEDNGKGKAYNDPKEQGTQSEERRYFLEYQTFYNDGSPVNKDGWFKEGDGVDKEKPNWPKRPTTLQHARQLKDQFRKSLSQTTAQVPPKFRIVDVEGKIVE